MKIFLTLVIACISYSAQCQIIGGYWGHQYGSKGLLLNGSVIASCNDETAIFYNPAVIGLTSDIGVALSLITPTYNYVKTRDLLGDDTQFSDSGLGLASGFVAAKFQPFSTDKINLGFTIFKRYKNKLEYDDRIVDEVEDSENTLFVGDLDYKKDMSETWVGLGFSFELHENFSFGFSHYLIWRGENLDLDFKKEFILKNDPERLISSWRKKLQFGYGVNGASLTKFGLSWRLPSFKIGVTYTTKVYGLLITDSHYKISDSKVRFMGEDELVSNSKKTDLVDYESPYSVGLGLQFGGGDTQIYFSIEYFSDVPLFSIIDDVDDPFDGLAANVDPVNTVVSLKYNRVINVAVGFEKKMNKKYSILGGARTDFSPQSLLDIGDGITFLSTSPDIFHISFGTAFNYRKSKFSLGIDYGFGFKSGGLQFVDLSNVTQENLFTFSGRNVVDTQTHSLALFMTYDL